MSCYVTWCAGHVISCDVQTCHVTWCATKYYSSTTPNLLQHYSVLQSTTPVLLWLPSSTPVLLCTTKYYASTIKYYASTTLDYKVLIQYYSVLLCTTPVLLCTTKYYNVLLQYYSSTTLYYKVLLRTTKYYCSTPLYYKVLLQYYFETSFTMRGTTGITLQPHQILRQPRKMNLISDPHRICNVIYNARSNRHHSPTSPNTAPATQNESHDWSASHMKRHLQCAEQQASPSNLTKYCACHAKWMSWLIVLTHETSFPMRRAARVTLQLHQILRLPRKMNVMIDPAHVWNVIYNARSNRYQPATSPNTAPATQNCIP